MPDMLREPSALPMDDIFAPTGVKGVFGFTASYEAVVEGLMRLIDSYRSARAEVLRFPPIMSRALVERAGYHKNFPHLLGCVCSLHGNEADVRAGLEGKMEEDWTQGLVATDLVLSPAACYPLYPLTAERGPVSAEGCLFDVASYCFRHEATHELGRMQAFRMREFVRIGTAEQAFEFRAEWLPLAQEIAERLKLSYKIETASDPFFGRLGKLMAASQKHQALKFELLMPIRSAEEPTACMSFNYHRDQFGITWGMETQDGTVAHSACVAFGIDRLALALLAAHGTTLNGWPRTVREALAF